MRDTGTPPHVPRLTVGPAEPLDGDPSVAQDRLGIGRDPDRTSLLERVRELPAVRAVRARPVPRTVVAMVSALVSGVGVAVYLGGPSEETVPPAGPVPVVRPESWLEVTEGARYSFESAPVRPEWRALVEQELARHPADAPLVLALGVERSLRGVPPGSFRLQASCAPREDALPVRVVVVEAHENNQVLVFNDEVLVFHIPCDGAVHAADRPLRVADYRPFDFYWSPTVDLDHTVESEFEDVFDAVVAVSRVPAD